MEEAAATKGNGEPSIPPPILPAVVKSKISKSRKSSVKGSPVKPSVVARDPVSGKFISTPSKESSKREKTTGDNHVNISPVPSSAVSLPSNVSNVSNVNTFDISSISSDVFQKSFLETLQKNQLAATSSSTGPASDTWGLHLRMVKGQSAERETVCENTNTSLPGRLPGVKIGPRSGSRLARHPTVPASSQPSTAVQPTPYADDDHHRDPRLPWPPVVPSASITIRQPRLPSMVTRSPPADGPSTHYRPRPYSWYGPRQHHPATATVTGHGTDEALVSHPHPHQDLLTSLIMQNSPGVK